MTIAVEIPGAITLTLDIWPRVFAILLVPVMLSTIVSAWPGRLLVHQPQRRLGVSGFCIVGLLALAPLGDGP